MPFLIACYKQLKKFGFTLQSNITLAHIQMTTQYFGMYHFLHSIILFRLFYSSSGNMTAGAILEGIASYVDVEPVLVPCCERNQGEVLVAEEAATGADVEVILEEPSFDSSLRPLPAKAMPAPKKRKHNAIDAQLEAVSKQIDRNKALTAEEHFALSLVDDIRAVRPERRIDLKLKILQVIKEFIG